MDLSALECCGIKELNGIQDTEELQTPEQIIRDFKNMWGNGTKAMCAFGIFSESNSPDYEGTHGIGRNLAAYITKCKLGTVKTTKPQLNPNSGAMVQAWLWRIDRDALAKFDGTVPRSSGTKAKRKSKPR